MTHATPVSGTLLKKPELRMHTWKREEVERCVFVAERFRNHFEHRQSMAVTDKHRCLLASALRLRLCDPKAFSFLDPLPEFSPYRPLVLDLTFGCASTSGELAKFPRERSFYDDFCHLAEFVSMFVIQLLTNFLN